MTGTGEIALLCDPEYRCARCNNFRDPDDLATLDGLPFCDGEYDRPPTCWQRTRAEHPVSPAVSFQGDTDGE